MENRKNSRPPRFMLALFQWFCHPALREEIEGDLLERFHKNIKQYGTGKARLFFVKEIILLFRPALIGNIYYLTIKLFPSMKKLQWIQLIALNGVVILCMFLPFLPGPYDKLSLGLSGMAQIIGFTGLLLVPFGILWLIQEIKKIAGNKTTGNNWSNGYYYAITATCICTFICLILVLVFLAFIGPSAAIFSFLVIVFSIYKLVPAIKNLKRSPKKLFNATPLYLLSVPLVAFSVRMFFIGPLSDYSRNYAIRQGQVLVNSIENYYTQRNHYPESINEIWDKPNPDIMGIMEFRYERNGNAYNLSFVQWQHVGATEEIVMYNKNDEHNVKGHFASFNTKQSHWRYYWLD